MSEEKRNITPIDDEKLEAVSGGVGVGEVGNLKSRPKEPKFI